MYYVYECNIAGEGVVFVQKLVNDLWRDIRIENVFYIPGLKKNLLSMGACTKKGFEWTSRIIIWT